MASQLAPLSASVTRILALSGFPSELKTRDIQAAFADWENVNGGFKIKWRDDTSLLIVFADPSTAKRAYLQTLASPPAAFGSPTSSKTATIKPYDGPDAQAVIQAVNARTHGHGHSTSRGHHSRSSVNSASMSLNGNVNGGGNGVARSTKPNGNMNSISSATSLASIPDNQPLSLPYTPRDHSPTLPNVPAHPTLSSLINLSLGPSDVLIPPQESSAVPIVAPADAAGPAPSSSPETQSHLMSSPPRVGDPARRMVGHALGIRHPTLVKNATTNAAGANGAGVAGAGVDQLQRAMGGLSVTDE